MKHKDIVIAGILLCVALLIRRSGLQLAAPISALHLDKAVTGHWQFTAAILGWVGFSLYWEFAKKNASAARTAETTASRSVHVVLANIAALLCIAPIHGIGRLLPISPFIMEAGLAIEALGLFIAFWARRHLGKHWSGEITIKEGHELIRTGPYKPLRHPIYTGILGLYLGTAVVTGERLALIGFVLAVVAYWRKIRLEEANLAMAFGPNYDNYRSQSWALVPWLY